MTHECKKMGSRAQMQRQRVNHTKWPHKNCTLVLNHAEAGMESTIVSPKFKACVPLLLLYMVKGRRTAKQLPKPSAKQISTHRESEMRGFVGAMEFPECAIRKGWTC